MARTASFAKPDASPLIFALSRSRMTTPARIAKLRARVDDTYHPRYDAYSVKILRFSNRLKIMLIQYNSISEHSET